MLVHGIANNNDKVMLTLPEYYVIIGFWINCLYNRNILMLSDLS